MRIPEIIRKARGDLNQTEFAAIIGRTQGEVSKYERGVTKAPYAVIEQCMAILDVNNADISADALAAKIIETASDDEHSPLRSMILQMLRFTASYRK